MSEEPEAIQMNKYFGGSPGGFATPGALERMVDKAVKESLEKGEFKNIAGMGKPLKPKFENPYMDGMEFKLNQIVINNNYTTEWIEMRKQARNKLKDVKAALTKARKQFEENPVYPKEKKKWEEAVENFREEIKKINKILVDYNLSTPSLFLQVRLLNVEKLISDIIEGKS
ncbi:dnaJ homolog subfamily C member 28-like [Glandiceps talaboti]